MQLMQFDGLTYVCRRRVPPLKRSDRLTYVCAQRRSVLLNLRPVLLRSSYFILNMQLTLDLPRDKILKSSSDPITSKA